MEKLNWSKAGEGWAAVAGRFALRVIRSGGLAFEWRVYENADLIASGTVPIGSVRRAETANLLLARGAAQRAAAQEARRLISKRHSQKQPVQRVYFDGCEGSGKTTLARETARRYELPFLTEVASGVLYEFQQRVGERAQSWARIRADVGLSSEVQERVMARQLADERATPPPAVYDRTLSCLAYSALYADNFRALLDAVPPEYLAELRRSVVFLVRPQRELLGAADGVRQPVAWENQIRIDQTMELLFKLWDVSFVSVEQLCAAQRQHLVDWCLQSRGFRLAVGSP